MGREGECAVVRDTVLPTLPGAAQGTVLWPKKPERRPGGRGRQAGTKDYARKGRVWLPPAPLLAMANCPPRRKQEPWCLRG